MDKKKLILSDIDNDDDDGGDKNFSGIKIIFSRLTV
jgi:hypothetical protein